MIISLSAKGRKPQKRQKQLNSSIKNYGEIPKRPKADYVGTQPDKHPLEVSPRRLRPPASGYSLSIGATKHNLILYLYNYGEIPKRPKADQVGTQPDKHPLEVSPRRLRPPASGYSLSIGAKIQLNTLFIYLRRNTQEAEGAPLLRE